MSASDLEPDGSADGRPALDFESRGRLGSAISNAVVRIYADYVGRGPTRARTVVSGNVVTVILQDTLTKAERRLVAHGEQDAVVSTRRVFQSTMKSDLVGAVQRLCNAGVVAFLSDHQTEPDYAVEVFVLDGPARPDLSDLA
jgi:uncharacterized protein YbcI